jgi:hypothetical protein
MSTTIIEELHRTAIAGWHTRLAEDPCPRHTHWQTKTTYYRAAAELLAAAAPGRPLTWRSIVEAAQPQGSRSTFYEVAGRRARRGMVAALIAEGSLRSYEIALQYRRADPVEQLIDEAKVWSFWPHRRRFVSATSPAPADLDRALLTWAVANPALGAANGYRPPACSVEDLTLLHGGLLAATRAAGRLTELLREAALVNVT